MDSATYSASSRLQAAGLQPAIALFEDAARSVLPRAPQPIAIADHGAANGYNSLLPVNTAIRVLRGRTCSDRAILVVHTDVAENDFSALFATLADDPDSYLKKEQAVFASSVGRSFYQQILPANSIALGWSSWAVHWLSRIPMPVPDHAGLPTAPMMRCGAPTPGRPPRTGMSSSRSAAANHSPAAGSWCWPWPWSPTVVRATAPPSTPSWPDCADWSTTVSSPPRRPAACRCPSMARDEKDFGPVRPSGRFEGLSIEHLELFNAEDRFWAQYRLDNDASAFAAKWAGFPGPPSFRRSPPPSTAASAITRAAGFVERLEALVATELAGRLNR